MESCCWQIFWLPTVLLELLFMFLDGITDLMAPYQNILDKLILIGAALIIGWLLILLISIIVSSWERWKYWRMRDEVIELLEDITAPLSEKGVEIETEEERSGWFLRIGGSWFWPYYLRIKINYCDGRGRWWPHLLIEDWEHGHEETLPLNSAALREYLEDILGRAFQKWE